MNKHAWRRCFFFPIYVMQPLRADELGTIIRKREARRDAAFKKVLAQTHARLRSAAKYDVMCWVSVPEMVLGEVQYDHKECVDFVVSSLKNGGFNVRVYEPGTLFVYWGQVVSKNTSAPLASVSSSAQIPLSSPMPVPMSSPMPLPISSPMPPKQEFRSIESRGRKKVSY